MNSGTAVSLPVEAPARALLTKGVSRATVIWYAIGEVPITVTMVLMGLLALFFYNSVMGLAGALAGLGLSAGLVVDAVADPYIGFRSDVSTHRFGRRHIFMVAGALAMGPCFFLLFSPPRGLPPAALFAWLLFFSIVFRFVSAVYRIPYLSLGAELTDDYHERTRVIAVRALAGLLGTLAAAGLSFLWFFPASTAGVDSKLNYWAYPKLGAFFGTLMTVTGLIAVWGTLGCRHRPAAAIASRAHRSLAEFLRGFAIAFRNPSFRRLWLSATLFFCAVVINASLAVHYFTWYVRISDPRAISAIQMAFYLGAVGGVFFWMWLARRFEKSALYFAGMAGTALALAAASLFMGEGNAFGTGSVRLLTAGHALAGVFASCLWVIPASMMADVADEDELATRQRREGLFFGILNFGEKMAAGVALLISGAILSYFVQLKPGEAVQSAEAVRRVGLVYGLLPAAGSFIAAVLIARFQLNAKTVGAIQRQLAELRNEPGPEAAGLAK